MLKVLHRNTKIDAMEFFRKNPPASLGAQKLFNESAICTHYMFERSARVLGKGAEWELRLKKLRAKEANLTEMIQKHGRYAMPADLDQAKEDNDQREKV